MKGGTARFVIIAEVELTEICTLIEYKAPTGMQSKPTLGESGGPSSEPIMPAYIYILFENNRL